MDKIEKRGQSIDELDEMAINLNVSAGKFNEATKPKGCCN